MGTIHPLHGLKERFYFIWSLHSFSFCPACVDKSGDFSCFHSIVYVHRHLPLIHFAPPPRLMIEKIANDLPIFASYCALSCICYCFSHLIGLFSVTWIFLLYKFTRFLNLFSVSFWRRANARNVRLYYPYQQYTNLFIFRFVSLRSTLRLLYLVLMWWLF